MPFVKTLPGGKTVQTNKRRKFIMGGGATCGATKKQRGPDNQGRRGKCLLAAGWGTSHPGFGRCKYHGGSLPSHIKHAAKLQLGAKLGAELEIDPINALMWCIRLAAGEMIFWKDRVELLKTEADLLKDTIAGKQVNEAIREYRRCRQELAAFSSDAIKLGLQERQVRMAEMYGQMIYTLINAILAGLTPYLSDEGKQITAQVVRGAMATMEETQLQLPAGKDG